MKIKTTVFQPLGLALTGLLLALIAFRAWEVNDGSGGILMDFAGKIFTLVPGPASGELPAFRKESIFMLTEYRLIFLFNSAALALSFAALALALAARRKGNFSVSCAAAATIGFVACLVVHKGIASGYAVMTLFGLAVIARKGRPNDRP